MGSTVSDYMPIIILGAVGIGAYYLFTSLGSKVPPANTGGTSGTTTATVQADLQSEIAAGNPPNYDSTQYAQWADSIFGAGSAWGTSFSDSQTVLNIMDSMDNLADVYSLILAFGTRGVYNGFLAITPTPMTLDAFITDAFSSAAITSFNNQLAYNQVSFTW